MIATVGIDPGAKGAIVYAEDGVPVEIVRLGKLQRHQHGARLQEIVAARSIDLILIEEVHRGCRLVASRVAMEERLRALDLPYRTIPAVTWQRAIGAGPSARSTMHDGKAYRARKQLLRRRCEAILGEDLKDAADAALIAYVAFKHMETSCHQ